MSIYIGNDLEDRLEALEALEMEKELAKKCNLEDRLKALEVENVSLKNTMNTIIGTSNRPYVRHASR